MIDYLLYILGGIYIATILSIMFKQYLLDGGLEPLAKIAEIFLWVLIVLLYPIVIIIILIRECKVNSLTELRIIVHPLNWDLIPSYRFKINTCTSEVSWLCTTYSWKRK